MASISKVGDGVDVYGEFASHDLAFLAGEFVAFHQPIVPIVISPRSATIGCLTSHVALVRK
jgi:hypothetical protein